MKRLSDDAKYISIFLIIAILLISFLWYSGDKDRIEWINKLQDELQEEKFRVNDLEKENSYLKEEIKQLREKNE